VVGPQAVAAVGACLLPPPLSMAAWIKAKRGSAQIERESNFFFFSRNGTFRRSEQTDESYLFFIGADGNYLIFIGFLSSAKSQRKLVQNQRKELTSIGFLLISVGLRPMEVSLIPVVRGYDLVTANTTWCHSCDCGDRACRGEWRRFNLRSKKRKLS
jgi:hypothetical protein